MLADPLGRRVPSERRTGLVRELTSRGYNAEREAVDLLAAADEPARALAAAVEAAPEAALVLTADHVRRGMAASETGEAGEKPASADD